MILALSKTQTKHLPALLKWAGGKGNQPTIYKRVAELYEPYRNTHLWVENFAGGLGVTHRIQPNRALLLDINPHLIRFHKTIQSGVDFCWQTWMMGVPYEELRQMLNDEIQGKAKFADPCFAALFYQINHRCYNGLWRVNRKGLFNAPIGRKSNGELLTAPFPRHVFVELETGEESWLRWDEVSLR